jgi:hypothetical protein
MYLLALSSCGATTRTDTEHPVERRPTREMLLHCTAALSFSLSLAYLRSRPRPCNIAELVRPR